MATVVGNDGLEGVPSLESICALFRSIVNDTFNGGAGQIATDTAPWMKPFLNSAIRDMYSDLRMVGDMRVIVDSYAVSGLPAVPYATPPTQVALTYQGFFNGTTWNPNLLLPANLMWLMKVWAAPSGGNAPFIPMQIAPAGLSGQYLDGMYEVRGNNQLWMNGWPQATDLRLRYMANFPDIVGDNIDFGATYVPIQDCTNAVAQKMVALYCQRMSPDQFSLAEAQAVKYTKKLIAESVLNSQTKQFERKPY